MSDQPLSAQLLSPVYASAAMRAIMSDRARLQRMLDFESALARAEAAVGVISASGSAEIADACNADRYDIPALVEAAIPSGSIAIAMVNALTAEVARRDKTAAGLVHWGATSQDVIDTALVLELRAAIDALLVDLEVAIKGFTTLAGRHRRTLTAARTMMQQALPMPFGLKLAGYAGALARSRERLLRLRRDALVLQFGGAAGTLAALEVGGLAVSERLAALLDLPLPEAPWHSQRDRLAEVAAALAILTGSCGKIARDVALMMQVEVGEASEPDAPGRGVSSALPHKRDPAGAAAALSAAAVAPNLMASILASLVQEHERGVGTWQTEWITFPALALAASGALEAVAGIAEGLEVDVEQMRANLERSGGRIMTEAVVYALAEKIGRADAYALVQELVRRADDERRSLRDVLTADTRVTAHLKNAEIEKLFVHLTYQGSAQLFIDRLVLAANQGRTLRRVEIVRPPEPKLPSAPQLAPVPVAELPRAEAPAAAPPAPLPEPPPAEISEPPAAASAVAAETPSIQVASTAEPPPAIEPANEPPPVEASAIAPEPSPVESAAAVQPELAPEPKFEPEPLPKPVPERALEPEPVRASPTLPDDAPGAWMDILSRADAEAQGAELAEGKRKRS